LGEKGLVVLIYCEGLLVLWLYGVGGGHDDLRVYNFDLVFRVLESTKLFLHVLGGDFVGSAGNGRGVVVDLIDYVVHYLGADFVRSSIFFNFQDIRDLDA
jgi:hypothetical protein